MSKAVGHEANVSAAGLLARLRTWWRHHDELANLPRAELERIAGELGMTGTDLETLSAMGPNAADLLYRRMQALGLATSDVEQLAPGQLQELQRTCSCCSAKAACGKDLAANPADPAWKGYCPNTTSLDAIVTMKDGR